MGLTISSLLYRLFPKHDIRVLMHGVAAAGKTTILYKLKQGDVLTTIPTIGINVESVVYKNIRFTVWDFERQLFARGMWRHYFENCMAFIFVVDASDRQRIIEAEFELSAMLWRDELKNAVVLILANKQDLPNALTPTEMAEKLRMCNWKHEWHIQGTSALTGSGLYEGLDYLQRIVSNKYRTNM